MSHRSKLQLDGGSPLLKSEVCVGYCFIWEFKLADEMEKHLYFTGTLVAELVLNITKLTRISRDCI